MRRAAQRGTTGEDEDDNHISLKEAPFAPRRVKRSTRRMPHNGNGLMKKLAGPAAISLCSWIGIRAFFFFSSRWEGGGGVVDGGHHLRGRGSFSGKRRGSEGLWIRPDSQPFVSFPLLRVYSLFAAKCTLRCIYLA